MTKDGSPDEVVRFQPLSSLWPALRQPSVASQSRRWNSNHCPRCGHKFRSSRAQDESAWFPPLSLSIPWLRLWGQHLGMRWRIPHRHSRCGQITLYLLTHCVQQTRTGLTATVTFQPTETSDLMTLGMMDLNTKHRLLDWWNMFVASFPFQYTVLTYFLIGRYFRLVELMPIQICIWSFEAQWAAWRSEGRWVSVLEMPVFFSQIYCLLSVNCYCLNVRKLKCKSKIFDFRNLKKFTCEILIP